jgi:hypothetical protein
MGLNHPTGHYHILSDQMRPNIKQINKTSPKLAVERPLLHAQREVVAGTEVRLNGPRNEIGEGADVLKVLMMMCVGVEEVQRRWEGRSREYCS